MHFHLQKKTGIAAFYYFCVFGWRASATRVFIFRSLGSYALSHANTHSFFVHVFIIYSSSSNCSELCYVKFSSFDMAIDNGIHVMP